MRTPTRRLPPQRDLARVELNTSLEMLRQTEAQLKTGA